MEEKSGLSLKEALDLLNAATGRVDAMWNFYMLVSVGVLTLGLDDAEDWHGKTVLSLAFIIFSVVNTVVLYRTQEAAALLYEGAAARAERGELLEEIFKGALAKLKRAKPRRMLVFHLMLDVVVLAALWTR
jgi:hypothetical protein